MFEQIKTGELSLSTLVMIYSSTRESNSDIPLLEYMCSKECADKETIIKFVDFIKFFNTMHPDNSIFSSYHWWRYCISLDRLDILDALLDCSLPPKTEGNMVRQLVYAGNINAANFFIERGWTPPKTVGLFQASNNLNWKLNRLEFLDKIGTRFILTEDERKALEFVLDKAETLTAE